MQHCHVRDAGNAGYPVPPPFRVLQGQPSRLKDRGIEEWQRVCMVVGYPIHPLFGHPNEELAYKTADL